MSSQFLFLQVIIIIVLKWYNPTINRLETKRIPPEMDVSLCYTLFPLFPLFPLTPLFPLFPLTPLILGLTQVSPSWHLRLSASLHSHSLSVTFTSLSSYGQKTRKRLLGWWNGQSYLTSAPRPTRVDTFSKSVLDIFSFK